MAPKNRRNRNRRRNQPFAICDANVGGAHTRPSYVALVPGANAPDYSRLRVNATGNSNVALAVLGPGLMSR